MTDAERLASYKTMRTNAHKALEQLSLGSASSVAVGDRSYGYEDRGSLLDYIGRLDRIISGMENPRGNPFTVYRITPA